MLWFAFAAACSDRAAEPVTVVVRVGIANASSDVGLFIAHKKGYFSAEGLNVSFVPFDSGARMVAPLGAGRLDVGAGSPSAGLYNAIVRGIPIKIVADRDGAPKGYGYQPLLVRRELVRERSFQDAEGSEGILGRRQRARQCVDLDPQRGAQERGSRVHRRRTRVPRFSATRAGPAEQGRRCRVDDGALRDRGNPARCSP